jgi:hypothetical protein
LGGGYWTHAFGRREESYRLGSAEIEAQSQGDEFSEAYLECTATQLKAELADDLLGSFTQFDQ